MQRARPTVPVWWQSGSGLILPTTLRQTELEPLGQIFPDAQIIVHADESVAGLPQSSLDDVRVLVAGLPCEGALAALSIFGARVFASREDRAAQAQLTREVFGNSVVAARLLSFLAREDGRTIVFSEQSVLVLERLLIEHAQPGLRRPLSRTESRILGRALLASMSGLAPLSDFDLADESDLAGWLPYLIQNGAYNGRPMLLGEVARAQEMLGRIMSLPAIAASRNACPLNDWMRTSYGLTIDEQFTVGFALGCMTDAFGPDKQTGGRCLVSTEQLDDLFHRLAWSEPKVRDALAVISGDQASLAAEFREAGSSGPVLAWNTVPFMRRPFLRCSDGTLLLLSPRSLQSWLSDGFHFRLLTSAQEQSKAAGTRKISARYSRFVGDLVEQYVLDLVRSVHPGERPVGGGRVFGEQPYNKNGSRTSDIAVDLGLDLVLIEVCSSRLHSTTLLRGDRGQTEADLHRLVLHKIDQLDGCITALADKDAPARIPADGDDPIDYSLVQRVWPVLVTGSGLTLTPLFWEHIHSKLPQALRQDKVQPLTILDLEGLEVLSALVEAGYALHDLLAKKTRPEFRFLELAIWLMRDPASPGSNVGRPRNLRETFNAAVDRAVALMDLHWEPPANLAA
jgi:hypothetical protein